MKTKYISLLEIFNRDIGPCNNYNHYKTIWGSEDFKRIDDFINDSSFTVEERIWAIIHTDILTEEEYNYIFNEYLHYFMSLYNEKNLRQESKIYYQALVNNANNQKSPFSIYYRHKKIIESENRDFTELDYYFTILLEVVNGSIDI